MYFTGDKISRKGCINDKRYDVQTYGNECKIGFRFLYFSNCLKKIYIAVQGQCLPGWTKFEKHCYLFKPNQYLSWAQARLSCNRQGGDLVSVSNREERDFLIYQLKDFSVTSVWTGKCDIIFS